MKNVRQRGFAVVELVLILVIVGIIAFVAWRVIEATGESDSANNQVEDTVVVPEKAKEVDKSSDLDTVDKQLDDTKVDDDTTTQLEDQTDF
jgi:hypothetical protein